MGDKMWIDKDNNVSMEVEDNISNNNLCLCHIKRYNSNIRFIYVYNTEEMLEDYKIHSKWMFENVDDVATDLEDYTCIDTIGSNIMCFVRYDTELNDILVRYKDRIKQHMKEFRAENILN